MEATTIKIYPETKKDLDELKTENESYDEVINKMISEIKNKFLVRELVEAYGTKAEEDKKIEKEWSKTSSDWN